MTSQLIYLKEDILGNSNRNGNIIKSRISPGSYIFFNARIGNKRYITAYFYVEKILVKGQHDKEIHSLGCSAEDDEVIVIGNRFFSKILTIPLDFDRQLIGRITSYDAGNTYFENKKAAGIDELEAIKDKTLNQKLITEEEKELLISLCQFRG